MFRFWKSRNRRQANWRSVRNYSDLHRALRAAWPVAPGEFLEGPLPLFFEFATSTDYTGDQIRTVEHARHWVQQVCEKERAARGDAAAFEAAATAMAKAAFEAHPWLVEAFEGRRGHHG